MMEHLDTAVACLRCEAARRRTVGIDVVRNIAVDAERLIVLSPFRRKGPRRSTKLIDQHPLIRNVQQPIETQHVIEPLTEVSTTDGKFLVVIGSVTTHR